MPRAREGSLELCDDGYHLRLLVERPHEDGSVKLVRKRIPLATFDKSRAQRMQRKLVADVEAGIIVVDESPEIDGRETFREFAAAHVATRKVRGVAMAQDEAINLTKHVVDVPVERGVFGDLTLGDVRPRHIVKVLESCATKLSKGTVAHVKRMLARVFRDAMARDLVTGNPVDAAEMPQMRTSRKHRAVLLDEEVSRFFQCTAVALDLRMMSLVARVEGGMRSGDVTRWDWSQIDRGTFAACVIPRAKTGEPQPLEVPDVLRPFLREWWIAAGRPSVGPVFPVTKGKRKGESRKPRGVSFAARLRRGLLAAGVTRHELHHETTSTLPVDFHSFRRAFAGALADAGVNAQRAMHLAAHSDPRVHQRYVGRSAEMMRIPAAALPTISHETSDETPFEGDESTQSESEAPQVTETRAGNGIRTRDPQLGKPKGTRAALVFAVEATQDNAVSVAGFVALRTESPPTGTFEGASVASLEPTQATPATPAVVVREVAGVEPADVPATFADALTATLALGARAVSS